MKSAVLEEQKSAEKNPLEIKETEKPEIEDGQVLIRVEANGVCHSDLHIVEGDLPLPREMFPLVPGHEIVGTVEESRSDVKKGERVGIGWFGKACGKCQYCISGKENLCPHTEITGLTLKGGYSDYVVAQGEYVTRIPDSISSKDAAPLFCAGLTAYTSVKKLNMRPGDRIGIFGIGGLGYYAIQFVEKMGGKAAAITRGHRELAESVGASEVSDEASGQYDGTIVFAPDSSLVSEAVKHTRSGGTIVIPAIVDRIEIPFQDFMWEKNVTSVASGLRPDTREMLEFVEKKGIKSMVDTMDLEEANKALQKLKENKVPGRIVLTPS